MKIVKVIAIALTLGFAFTATAQDQAASLQDLLKLVEEGRAAEAAEARQREQRFAQQRGQQQQLLTQARNERSALERRSQELEDTFEANEIVIVEKTDALTKRLGSLKELFGVLQQVAGDTRGLFDSSITSAQYKDRGDFLTELAQKMGTSSQLASIEEIERLWFEIQREMTETGSIARFTAEVTAADGNKESREVVRVGAFNLVSDGNYLSYVAETGTVVELPRQPQGRYVGTTSDLVGASSGLTMFGMDPTRGSLLSNLIQSPTPRERVDQGGLVGYLIIALGIVGLLIALERLVSLSLIGGKVTKQLKSDAINENNPLGRVMKVYQDNPDLDQDAIEVKLGEAILKEMPKLQRGITFLKIISVVAPLMGLLGTVTGMIKTFQAITLFGTGDPKLMAGGISQALMTTVLGLCVAIPTVLLHTIVHGRSRRVIHVLQEQGAGLVAKHMERTK
ncbi:MAG: MotA/TolQ/ExbB proton channel family protein [Xanthomonadales bacterium]|nr:MotA/TolQ/ExbB proton channel family protein [Xanthomonadales bacterium]